jgi:hypothetical protein
MPARNSNFSGRQGDETGAWNSSMKISQDSTKENEVFPQTFESWVYLLFACFVGFFIGQWIKKRRDKLTPPMMNTIAQGKPLSKKARRKARRLSK